MATTLERVVSILTHHSCIEGVWHAETTLRPNQHLDSLDVVEVMMEIEDEFNIEILDDDAEKLMTVQQVVDFVDSKVAV